MKKKKLICTAAGCLAALFLPIFVSAIDYNVDASIGVYDYADLLTDREEQTLAEEAHSLDEKHGMDFVIVTINDDEGMTSEDYAQDFYDYNAFRPDGLLLLINMDYRELWICGTGKGQYIFHDGQIENILDDIIGYASDDNFYGTAAEFLKSADRIAVRATESAFSRNLRRIPFFLLGGMAIAGISLAIMVSKNKLRRTATEASAYKEDGGLRLTHRQDIFLRSAMTKTRIETSSGSSGGRGGHTGSSGRSHSGGGRRF